MINIQKIYCVQMLILLMIAIHKNFLQVIFTKDVITNDS